MANVARLTLVLVPWALFLPGCGESAPAGPTEAGQQKVQAVSKDLVTKYGYPSAKGPVKSPPRARR